MTKEAQLTYEGLWNAMNGTHPYAQYRQTLNLAIRSKCNEFSIFGYNDVTDDQIWDYLLLKKWKKDKEDVHLHQLINDVLSVKIGEFMHFKTIEAFKYSQENKGPDFESFKDLFK
ncbi:post-transcriptional regulator [Peribacillus faecalis]|nr:post-transcriptional regulator [Peribacillus faecalis]